jgi:hypothetical protein
MPRSGAPENEYFQESASMQVIEQFALRAARDLPQRKADKPDFEELMKLFLYFYFQNLGM